jgi:hypothetical protein
MRGRLAAMGAAKAEVVAFLELAVVHSQRCGHQKKSNDCSERHLGRNLNGLFLDNRINKHF